MAAYAQNPDTGAYDAYGVMVFAIDGEATVNELAKPFEMKLPAISKHVKILERAGLITRGQRAQYRPCALDPCPRGGRAGAGVRRAHRYVEVTEPTRLVYTETMADERGNPISPESLGMPPQTPGTTEVTVVLDEPREHRPAMESIGEDRGAEKGSAPTHSEWRRVTSWASETCGYGDRSSVSAPTGPTSSTEP